MINIFNEEAKIFTLNKTLICNARFLKKEENIIHLAAVTENVPNFQQEVYVVLTNDVYGLFTYRCITQDIIISKSETSRKRYYSIQFYVNENVSVIQRRRDIKVKVKIYTELTLVYNIGEGEYSDETSTYQILIKDISASGMLFVAKKNFKVGQKFHFVFDQAGAPFLVYGEIVRKQEDGENNGYGCKFVDLTPSKESIIRQYVYRMQILLKKSKDS